MPNIAFNHTKYVLPFIFCSKFFLKKINDQPFIKTLEVSLRLDNKIQIPEILFWALFSLNKKKTFLSFFYKKKYFAGKSIFTKNYLTIKKKFGCKKQVLSVLFFIYQHMIIFSKEIKIIKIYPLLSKKHKKIFKFYETTFEEKYNGLINLSPRYWTGFNMNIALEPQFIEGFHFRFLLQNMKLPVN